MSKTILAGALMAAVLLGAAFAASADSGHEDKAAGASKGEHHGASEGQDHSPTHSMTPAGAWAELMKARDAIAGDVESGTLGDIHEKSEPLPDLTAALLAQSGDLDPNKRARVEGAIKQMARVSDSLHTAADGGDLAGTRKQLSRLDSILKLISVQYPDGVLDGGAHKMSGHGDHSAAPGNGHGAHAHMQRPSGVVDASAEAVIRVRALDQLRFEPRRIEIQAGVPTRIELENLGALAHALVVKTPDGEQDWVHIHVPPGVTGGATYRLDAPGTYALQCTIPGHTEGGMAGELVVLASHSPANQGR